VASQERGGDGSGGGSGSGSGGGGGSGSQRLPYFFSFALISAVFFSREAIREITGDAPVPVLSSYKAECKKKTGEEKGAVADRTEFEEVLKEWSLFVGAVNLRLDEDLNRPDGKKFGVVGGRNADGPDHPVVQVVASILQLAPALQSQIRGFIKKVNQSSRRRRRPSSSRTS
jgi:hypothetical protein